MKLSNPWRWGLALALVSGVGLAYVASLLSPTTSTTLKKRGLAGFDFTRIGHNGLVLARQDAMWRDSGSDGEGTRWDCLRDNVTGLWWEAKTNEDAGGAKHLRHVDHTYSGSGAAAHRVFDAGQPFGGRCSGLPDASQCSTQAYVDAVNTAGLCGFSDWRLPTVAELKPLTSINKGGATIDVQQFPNTAPAGYWTASAYPHRKNYAWYVYFAGAGDSFGDATSASYAVRLVRNGR